MNESAHCASEHTAGPLTTRAPPRRRRDVIVVAIARVVVVVVASYLLLLRHATLTLSSSLRLEKLLLQCTALTLSQGFSKGNEHPLSPQRVGIGVALQSAQERVEARVGGKLTP